MLRLQSERLQLIACDLAVAQAACSGPAALGELLGVHVPGDWPAQGIRNLLPEQIRELQADPQLVGWGIWLMVSGRDSTVAGDLGFKGRPDRRGMVEIGYSVLPAFQGQGYATEGTRALVHWAWRQGVTRIVAQCRADNTPSYHVLEKLGMRRVTRRGDTLWWELRH